MIRNSYIFLDGISEKTEKNIWSQGIRSWDDFLKNEIKGISPRRKQFYDTHIRKARKKLYDGDSSFFSGMGVNSWRLYDFFRDECVFLDIEFSSVRENGYITVLTLFDGLQTKTFVRDIHRYEVNRELSRYKLAVSFNGSVLDVPYMKKRIGIEADIPHMDLRFLCSSLGYEGGLKEIEKKMGIRRDNEIIEKLYSGDPLKLWKTFLATGDKYYLDLLVEYNQEDTINLKKIADTIYSEMSKRASFLS